MRFLSATLSSLLLCTPAAASGRCLPLEVRETAGVARRHDPVTTGVPVPRQAGLRSTDRLRLVDASGNEVEAQFRVLSRWYAPPEDAQAPIRWLLVDFQANAAANEVARYELRADRPPAPIRRPIEVRESAEAISVSTGAANFRIARDRFNLFDLVEIDADGNGDASDPIVPGQSASGGVSVRREDGSVYLSSEDVPPDSVRVEEAGPLRTVVRVDGRLNTRTHNGAYAGALDYLEYTARYHFYRDKASTRVLFTVRNPDRVFSGDYHNGGTEVFHSFEEMSLRVPVRLGDARSFLMVGDRATSGAVARGERVLLYQDSSGGTNWGPSQDGSPYWATSFRGYQVLRDGGSTVDEGLRALGVGDLSDDRLGVAVSIRDFWQNFPKGILVSGAGRVDLQLFPASWSTPHRLRGGLQKTHDVLFQFHRGTAAAADVESAARAFQQPMRALASPEAYRRTRALGWISTPDVERFRTYEEAMEGIFDYRGTSPAVQGNLEREMEEKDEYGWLNFGDHYRAGFKNLRYWGNNEFDFAWILILGYLRHPQHDERYFHHAQAVVRHLMDVDVYHTDLDLFWANRGMKKHDASGVIDHNRDPNLSHFWVDGLIAYYWLTGDESARDTMREILRWLAARESDPVRRPGRLAFAGEVRSKGWALQALVGLFECFGDRSIVEFALRVITGDIAPSITEEGFILNSIGLVDPWMHGYVTEGLGRYLLAARALDAAVIGVRDLFVSILRFQSTLAWSEEQGMMAYTWDPATRRATSFSSNLSQTAVNGFAYGYVLTGDPEHLRWARRCYDSYYEYRSYPYYYSTTLQTPAKNAGFRLRFAQPYMCLEQLLGPGGDAEPPRIVEVSTASIGRTSATVRFRTPEASLASVHYFVEGGPTTVASQAPFLREFHSIPLSGLSPSTTYRFRVEAADLAGNAALPVQGTFRTLDPDVTPPVISAIAATSSESEAVIAFETDEEAFGAVEYGTSPSYGSEVRVSAAGRVHEISFPVQADTLYHFRVRATDPSGNSSVSAGGTVQSAAEEIVPASFDAHLVANYGGQRVSTSGLIEVRDNNRLHYDGLLWFDLRSIRRGAAVSSATLQIVTADSGSGSPLVTVRPVLRTATSASTSHPQLGFDPADVCFLYRDLSAGVPWTDGGGPADLAMGPVSGQFQVSRGGQTCEVDLTDLVRRWVDRTAPNEGIFLEVHGTYSHALFRSIEDADRSAHPRLRIVYRR